MNNLIADQINELKNDRIHGANWLSMKAINIFQQAIQESSVSTVSDFIADLSNTAKEITCARPSMISISNYINRFSNYIITIAQNTNRLESLRNIALSRGRQLLIHAEESSLKAAQYGAKMIGNGDTIITCSYSSTVCQTFKIAHSESTKFKIIAAESEYGENRYGDILAEKLSQYHIPVNVIKDNEINKNIKDVSLALVGADSILPDVSLINGIPTAYLAKAASNKKIPFYPVCETAKFDIKNHKNKHNKLEPGFEIIPPVLITGIITEEGLMNSDKVIDFITEASKSPL